jgi:hypothetical protein
MGLQEIRWEGMDWTDPIRTRDKWEAVANMVMNI